MRIGIIGTGRMGSGLARLWGERGHALFLGSREPERAGRLAAAMVGEAHGGRPGEAAAFGDLLLLATPWVGAREALRALGPLDGQILVDCTNPLVQEGPHHVPEGSSAAELIQEWAPGARVVKAFNTIHWQRLHRPRIGDTRLQVPICGDDAPARELVAGLANELGFEPLDLGPLSRARYIEELARLWIQMAFDAELGTDFGLRIVTD